LASELGPNTFGEPVEPGRVDCYLSLPSQLRTTRTTGGVGCWLSRPAGCCTRPSPQPDGSLVYELATGHPDRQPAELVFPADLTEELRAWPQERWAALGVDLTRWPPP
jgi:hypothetical protein